MIRIGSAQSDGATQHGETSIRNPQVLDGFSALPHEKAGQCEDRDVAPCPVLQHEARHEYSKRARIASGDAGLKPEEEDTLLVGA